MRNLPLISIVIPTYNEEKNISLIYKEILRAWDKLRHKYKYEIIFVNDGSEDNSILKLRKIADQNFDVKVIDFSRNFGHQVAIQAGLKYSRGDCVVMMDCDLQHPPQLIPKLVEKWEEGYEIVNTVRVKTENEGLIKRITSRGFYWLINRISNVNIQRGSADFRLVSKTVVEVLEKITSEEIFYRGLINWIGFERTYINYQARERHFGKSSYTLKKMILLAKVGIISFSMLPIKIILIIGGLVTLGSFLLLLVMLYYRYFIDIEYFSTLAFVVVFVVFNSGILLISQGIIAVYVMNILERVRKRPNYIIRGKINFGDESK